MLNDFKKYYMAEGMESRVFKIAIGGVLFSMLTFAGNLGLDLSFWKTCLPLFNAAVIGFLLFWAVQTQQRGTSSTMVMYFIAFILFPAVWVFSVGSYGSIPLLAMMNAAATTLLLYGAVRTIMLLGVLLLCNAFIFYEMSHLQAFAPHISGTIRYFDYSAGFTASFIVSVTMIYLSLSEHRKAIAVREELQKEIEQKNEVLQEKNLQLEEVCQKLRQAYEKVEQLSIIDSLTGIYNRQFLLDKLQETIQVCRTKHQPFGIIMLDLDFFKSVNDTYGHGFGDEVLKTVAATIQECLRKEDILGHYDGEGFLVILPQSTRNIVCEIAEQIGVAVGEITWRYPIKMTVSSGVSMYHPDFTLEELLERTDRNLYVAKRTGRNRVVADNIIE